MKKVMLLLLILTVGVFGKCVLIPTDELSKDLCDSYAADGENVNAGCCYKQVEEWGDCSLYLLKGARHAEMLWDLNRGSFQQGTVAKQFYNPQYNAIYGTGSETGVCLNNYGDDVLIEDVDTYYTWITAYGYPGPDGEKILIDPPFDMDALIDDLEDTLHPPVVTATPTSVPTATPRQTVVPTATPEPAADNTGVLFIVVLILVAVVGYFFFMKKNGKSSGSGLPMNVETHTPGSGYLYKAAEKAKEEHKEETKMAKKKKKKAAKKTKKKKK